MVDLCIPYHFLPLRLIQFMRLHAFLFRYAFFVFTSNCLLVLLLDNVRSSIVIYIFIVLHCIEALENLAQQSVKIDGLKLS